jgi:hypothetical protein
MLVASARTVEQTGCREGVFLPIFQFSKAFSIARGVKVFLNLESGVTRHAPSDAGSDKKQTGKIKNAQQRMSKQANNLKAKDQEISRLKDELRAVKEWGGSEGGTSRDVLPSAEHYREQAEDLKNARQHISTQRKLLRSKTREIFQIKNELRDARERLESAQDRLTTPLSGESRVGTLPDFVVIGARKCGTSTLYYLLTQHPQVERAVRKELHFFDNHFDRGVEWYQQCFPSPRWEDGRKTITGEATPKYLFHPAVPERVATVIPQAKLIALLRNPVDRAYSHYHGEARHGRENRSFEEAVEAEKERLLAEGGEASGHKSGADNTSPPFGYLAGSIYVDQLQRWSMFFGEEQLLVLKSEDFFEHTAENLERILDFLGLPDWKPETLEARNEGTYSRDMDPETRRQLEEYFEPHNQRLYEYLGVNFGW